MSQKLKVAQRLRTYQEVGRRQIQGGIVQGLTKSTRSGWADEVAVVDLPMLMGSERVDRKLVDRKLTGQMQVDQKLKWWDWLLWY